MDRRQASLLGASLMGVNMKVPGPTRLAGKESISCINPSTERCPEVIELSLNLMSVTLPIIDCSTSIACSPGDDELLIWLARSTIAHPSISQVASCIVHFGVV